MFTIHFKNLEKSELANDIVSDRLQEVISKFTELANHNIRVTVAMENSPQQSGLDVFKVKLCISGPRYRNILLEKAAPNLYVALAHICDTLLERLNRYGDRQRVRSRHAKRSALSSKFTETNHDSAG